MTSITWLNDIRVHDRKTFGGKAAMLGELKAAGFRVPNGFVIADDASEQDCLSAFDALGATLVAVRSSAVSEDSRHQSWAGEFETFTNVSRDALMAKIQSVRDSLFSKRAASYRDQTTGGPAEPSSRIAVLVQAMVPADVAGVLFSVNPVTNDATRMLIEASQGLGESVVSGLVIPDHVEIDKQTGAVISYDAENKQLLDQTMIQELVVVGKKIESLLQAPCDVEWAFADGQLAILQARPVTT